MSADATPLPGVTTAAEPASTSPDDVRDLGFGARVAAQSRRRLLNRDGSFNVTRVGLPLWRALSPYQTLVCMSWPRFFALLFAGYVLVNMSFAVAYLACGPGALTGGTSGAGMQGRFADAFFFSVQTLATIGYGRITPEGLAANTLVALEALLGIVGFAIATGLAFARFSRPSAQVLWSERAVVAPHRGATAFMFRLANQRKSQLVQVEAQVIFSRFVAQGARMLRRFETLPLERSKVMFFPLHWTVVHAITPDSPLYGDDAASLRRDEAEFLILLSAFDETSAQSVHTRTSYRADEVLFGVRFADMFHAADDQMLTVDLRRLHEVEPVA